MIFLKKIIFVCGASGIGKSTTCAALYKQLDNSALVDSDYCRMIHPFEFSDELKEVVTNNMFTMLRNYINCSSINNIIFLYGFHGPRKQIFDNIIDQLSEAGLTYTFVPIILECELEENIRRARNDGRHEQRIQYGIEASRNIYHQYDYPRIDITHLTVDEAVKKMIELIG